jgi:hypothetical protein
LLGALSVLALLEIGPMLVLWLEMPGSGEAVTRLLGAAEVSKARAALAVARAMVTDHYLHSGRWPEILPELSPIGAEQGIRVDSPAPGILRASLPERGIPSKLAGRTLILRLDIESGTWRCDGRTDKPLPPVMLPADCSGAAEPRDDGLDGGIPNRSDVRGMLTRTLALPALAVLAAALAGGWIYQRAHPLVRTAEASGGLTRLPWPDLARAVRMLRRTRRLAPVLKRERIPPSRLQQALTFDRSPAESRCALVRQRLRARADGPAPAAAAMQVVLPVDLPLELTRLVIHCPDPTLSAAAVIDGLRATGADWQPTLVVATDSGQNAALRVYGDDPTNGWMVPSPAEITKLLIGHDPRAVLLGLVARQLAPARVSPYQTRGGVNRDTQFVGRASILARILGSDRGSFLLIGGRQLGKSSLLKKIQRLTDDLPGLECHYLVLHDGRLELALRRALRLDRDTPLERLVEHLSEPAEGPRRLLLIDEADRFIRAEMQTDYPLLNALRAVAESGRCRLVLAGFWDLYRTAVLDYQSPLRNLAEPIPVGALEDDACRELATRPMHLMGLKYASNDLVEKLIRETGRRANLVAIACDALLRLLPKGQRIIDADLLGQALAGPAILEALSGWTNLSSDESAARIDRICVYLTAASGRLEMRTVVARLAEAGLRPPPEHLTESIARLELAYLLRNEAGGYRFAVPLFARLMRRQDTHVLLTEELRAAAEALRAPGRNGSTAMAQQSETISGRSSPNDLI